MEFFGSHHLFEASLECCIAVVSLILSINSRYICRSLHAIWERPHMFPFQCSATTAWEFAGHSYHKALDAIASYTTWVVGDNARVACVVL